MTNNQIKGDLYETFIYDYLYPHRDIIYLWKNIPEKHLIKCGFVTELNEYRLKRKHNKSKNINAYTDIGADLLSCHDGIYKYIQCKNYSESNAIGIIFC